jgi:hypothetical protein
MSGSFDNLDVSAFAGGDAPPAGLAQTVPQLLAAAQSAVDGAAKLVASPPWLMASNTLDAWKGGLRMMQQQFLPQLKATMPQALADAAYAKKWADTARALQSEATSILKDRDTQGLLNALESAITAVVNAAEAALMAVEHAAATVAKNPLPWIVGGVAALGIGVALVVKATA